MRGVSDIIAVILILLIVAALASLVYSFLSGTVISLEERGTEEVTHITEIVSSCMFVDSMHQNKVYLRNCGDGVITNDTINIYINDEKYDFEMAPSLVNEGELAIVSLPVWGISLGEYELRITNPKTEALAIFEAKLPNSCVLSLDFDEGSETSIHDYSGYENDGTLKGDTSWVNGKYEKALEFDGNGDYAEIPDSDSLNPDYITLSAWVYPIAEKLFEESASEAQIVKKIDFPNQKGYFLVWENNTQRVRFQVANGTIWRSAYGYSVPRNQWTHIVGIYDGSYIRVYVNGILDDTSVYHPGTIASSTDNLRIGAEYAWFKMFNGTIDSVRIYNKALTPDETVILKMK